MKTLLNNILLILLLSSVLSTQAQDKNEGITFNPKIGLFMALNQNSPYNKSIMKNSELGGVLGFEINLRHNTLIHSISILRVKENYLFFEGRDPANTFHQFDYLFGKYHDEKKIRYQYQIGIGLLFGHERDKFLYNEPGLLGRSHYSSKRYTSIAFPIKIGRKKSLKNGDTFGVDFQLNINERKIILMPLLSYGF